MLMLLTIHERKTCEGPSTLNLLLPDTRTLSSIPSKEPEQNPETSTEKVQNPNLENTAHVPPPEEEESIFIEIPKPKAKKTVNVEIQDLNSPRPNSSPYKWLSSLLATEQRETRGDRHYNVNAECSAIIMNKVPEKLKDPGKFLIPCALQELDRTIPLTHSDESFSKNLLRTVNHLFNKMDEEFVNVNSNVLDSDESALLNTPLSNKVECFTPEDDIDEIDAFPAIEVSTN
ncbi:hypothetical protein Tco_0383126 [Tanacetum coccineum]